MEILAISAKYPTLLQTWFINYVESLEKLDHRFKIASLYEQDYPFHPKVKSLEAVVNWCGQPRAHLLKRSTLYIIRNLFTALPYKYIYNCFKYSTSLKDTAKAISYISILEVNPPQIAHSHSDRAGYYLLPAIKTLNVPVVATFHGLPPEGVDDISFAAKRKYFNSVNLIVTNTEFSKAQLQTITQTKTPIRVICQGITLADFPYRPTSPPKDKKFVAVTVGRLDRLKGHIYAIDAIRTLKLSGYDIEYHIVGAGLFKDDIQSYIEEKDLRNFIKVLGPLTGRDLIEELDRSHVFVLPSYTEKGRWAETQGIVLQEAQASGKIVIASDSGGISECIVNQQTGFLVEQKSSASIAKALAHILDNTSQWKKWQTNARRDVETRFCSISMARKLEEVYQSLVH